MKRVVFVVLVLLSLQTFAKIGDNKEYFIISQDDYHVKAASNKNVVLKRHIIIPEMDNNFKDLSSNCTDEEILSKFAFMLKKNKSEAISSYIENLDKEREINSLILGLYYFSKSKYTDAIESLKNFSNSKYSFLKYLIIADCKYELLSPKSEYKKVIKYYQLAFDNAKFHNYKTLIHNRIKYIKYR